VLRARYTCIEESSRYNLAVGFSDPAFHSFTSSFLRESSCGISLHYDAAAVAAAAAAAAATAAVAAAAFLTFSSPCFSNRISAPGYRARFVQRARCNASNAFHSAIDPPSSFRLSVARWHSFLLRRRRRCDVTTPTMRRCNRDFLSFPAQWNARRQFRT